VASPLLGTEGMTRRERRNRGLTLIELLVVVAVIGILAAVAIPQFASRQAKAFDARVAQDTRNAAAGQELYFLEHFEYFDGDCAALPGYTPSAGIQADCEGNGVSFEVRVDHPSSTRRCTWNSISDPVMVCTAK